MGFLDTSAFRRFAADKMQKVNLFETPRMFCDVYCLQPGQAQKVHAHSGATKFCYVIEGQATFSIGDATRTLGPGGVAWSVPDEAHGVENRGNAQSEASHVSDSQIDSCGVPDAHGRARVR